MGKPSALFVDRTYVEQQLATLRSDIITVLAWMPLPEPYKEAEE